MLGFLKNIVSNIKIVRNREIDEEQFDGYGFMRRVYGVEEMPNFQTIVKLARTDTLTKAFNRLAFDDFIEREIDVSRRYGAKLSLVLLNIDYFSHINQQFSHLVCDELLKEFAGFITSNIRKADILFRWGGDEFLIIMTHTDSQKAEQFSRSMKEKLNSHVFENVGRITSSIGFTEIMHDENIDEVVVRLEDEYHQAKRQRIAE